MTLVRFALAGMFVWAGFAKLFDPQAFADGIASFRVFPDSAVNILAMSVPMVEIFTAGLLVARPLQRQGAMLCCLLTITFFALFTWAFVHGLNVNCSCFGKDAFDPSPAFGLWRSVILAIMSLALYISLVWGRTVSGSR